MEKTYCPTTHLNGFEVKGEAVKPDKLTMGSLYGMMANPRQKDNIYISSKDQWRDRNERYD